MYLDEGRQGVSYRVLSTGIRKTPILEIRVLLEVTARYTDRIRLSTGPYDGCWSVSFFVVCPFGRIILF